MWLTSFIINFYMEEVYLCVIYDIPLDTNEGDLSLHTSQEKCISDINVDKISNRDTPVELSHLEPR